MSYETSRPTVERYRCTSSSKNSSGPNLVPHINYSEEKTRIRQQIIDKRRRKSLNPYSKEQLRMLHAVYKRTSYPSEKDYSDIAHAIGLAVANVKCWFAEKRNTDRKVSTLSNNGVSTSSTENPHRPPILVSPFGHYPSHYNSASFHKINTTWQRGDIRPSLISPPLQYGESDTIRADQLPTQHTLGKLTTAQTVCSAPSIERSSIPRMPKMTTNLQNHQTTQSISGTKVMPPMPILSRMIPKHQKTRLEVPTERTQFGSQPIMDSMLTSQNACLKLPSQMTSPSSLPMIDKVSVVQSTQSRPPLAFLTPTHSTTNKLPIVEVSKPKSPTEMSSPLFVQPVSGATSRAQCRFTKSPTKESPSKPMVTTDHLHTQRNTLPLSTERAPSPQTHTITNRFSTSPSTSATASLSLNSLTPGGSAESRDTFSTSPTEMTSALSWRGKGLPQKSASVKDSTTGTQIMTDKLPAQNIARPTSPLQLEKTSTLSTKPGNSHSSLSEPPKETKPTRTSSAVSAQTFCTLPPITPFVDMCHPVENFPHHLYPCVTNYMDISVS